MPRPQVPQHGSSPSTYSFSNVRKQLPSLPKSSSGISRLESTASEQQGRNRALTASSYASTAIPPKLDSDLNFGESSFDDMFSGLSRKESPELPKETAGRSLLSEKRTLKTDPIKINSNLHIEPPLQSWESRGSAENLISPRSDNDSPPPPPPPHKFSSYARIASESPTQTSPPAFQDVKNPYRESSPEPQSVSLSSSSVNSYDTPLSSRPASNRTNNTTPKASLAPIASTQPITGEELFSTAKAAVKTETISTQRSIAPPVQEHKPTAAPANAGPGKRVMTQAEFREQQKRQMSNTTVDESSDEEDYEDEEEAIRKREEEEIMRRKNQQMHFAREAMRRSTTAPTNLGRPESVADTLTMGFPSETSMKADEWEDEDVPLGILAQHGFPSQTRNRLPNQPANAAPSYYPERPASTGAMSNRVSQAHLPAFARNLPADPYIGGGLVRPTNRESLGMNGFRGPASIAGDSIAGGMGMGPASPMMYQDAGMSQPSLVDQIQMRDMSKQKYMGGASNKKPQGGPFTGMLGQQMNAAGHAQNPTRMSQMPMNGMNGMNPMMGMMGGQMPMMGMGMGMGMGMNPMGYPMGQQDQMMQMQQFQQMQQMIAMQQMQLQQMQAMQQQPQGQDPRMSMAMPNNNFYGGGMMSNGSLLSVPGIANGPQNPANRPMSFMSVNGNQVPQQPRPIGNFMGPGSTYTPSIAPSERSNIGLSARYRPVVNHSDSLSNGTSMTLQASGANQNKPGVIKGILKKVTPQSNDDDEDWSKMAARKNRAAKGKENNASDLEELTRGLNL